MSIIKPVKGEIWLVDLNPIRGREQAGFRPCLIVSTDLFNQGKSGLVVVLPMTSKNKNIPLHVMVNPPEGGLKKPSFIKCEDIRSVSIERLTDKLGVVSSSTMFMVSERLRILLEL